MDIEISEYRANPGYNGSPMIERRRYLDRIAAATGRAPVTSLLGPRQCGKTTLAREFASTRESTRFDLGSEADVRQLANPELVLGELRGLVVLDEIQILLRLFNVLRVLVDRPDADTRFLILGSASPMIVRGVSQSLAGRVEFIDMSGFDLEETGAADMRKLWRRGGCPRSWLADSEAESVAWRRGFIRTFLERDLPQLGVPVPAVAMRRFWNTLAHHHGQTANAANLGRSIGVSDKTARRYLDLLTGAWMVRQVQPWFENLGKRQVKAPKVYVRDTGLLHSLLGIDKDKELLGHRRVGASWEGFAMEQILSALDQPTPWFWSAHGLGEIDLLLLLRGRRIGFEMKFSEAPRVRASTREIASALGLDHLFVVCPTRQAYPAASDITVLPATAIPSLPERIEEL